MRYDQSDYQLRFEWGLPGMLALSSQCEAVVIVDTLSFSTCVDVACRRGATVYPYQWKDDRAAAFAREKNAILASRRSKETQAGFSLSPVSLRSLRSGTRLVLPSPNGSTLSFESTARRTFCGCLRNASALARFLNSLAGPKLVVAAGERWEDHSLRPALEDLVGAGAILEALEGSASPEAEWATLAFRHARKDGFRKLRACSSAKELEERGYAEDVEMSLDYDCSAGAIELQDGAYREIRGSVAV